MTLIPGIKQISQVGNDMYIQGAFPVGIGNTEVSYLADPADTRLLAGRDPVIEEVSVGMSGVETGIKTATGAAPLQITDTMQGMLRFLETNIKPVQDLNGYANPWPAGGGVNKFGPNTTTLSDCYLNSTGGEQSYIGGGWMISDYIAVKENTQYTFNPNSSYGNSAYFGYYDTSKVLISTEPSQNVTFTTPADCAYMRFSYRDTSTDITLVLGATSPANYTPYANICPIQGWTGCNVYVSPTTNQADATVYPCTWQDDAGTVYGGTIDLISGWMTVTHKTFSVTTWSGQWGSGSNGFAVFRSLPDGIRSIDMLSDKFNYNGQSYTSMPAWTFGGGSGASSTVTFIIGSATTYEEAQQWLSDNGPITVYYKLDTPLSYQVPGNQILTQAGANYIWTDCGDTITAAYVAVK